MFELDGFSIFNSIVNFSSEQLLRDKKTFDSKYDDKILEDNINASRLSDYGMTLVSLKAYCESVGLKCKWDFNTEGLPFFKVGVSLN